MPLISFQCVFGLKGLLGSRGLRAYRLTPGRVKLDEALVPGALTLTLVTYSPPSRWYCTVPLIDARNFDSVPAGTTVASVAVTSISCFSSQILLTECKGLTTLAIWKTLPMTRPVSLMRWTSASPWCSMDLPVGPTKFRTRVLLTSMHPGMSSGPATWPTAPESAATSVSISVSIAARRALESLTNSSKRFNVALVGAPPSLPRSFLHLSLMSVDMDANLASKAAKSHPLTASILACLW